jgi:hypothetical protein
MAARIRTFSVVFKDKAVACVLQQDKSLGACELGIEEPPLSDGYPRRAPRGVLVQTRWAKKGPR